MTTRGRERSACYSELCRLEERLADELKGSVDTARIAHWFHEQGDWVLHGHYGERVRRLRCAIGQSEGIALDELQRKLGRIDLAALWPILREALHDIALYLGGSAIAGAVAGGGLGFFLGGAGALPGSIAGTAIGLEAGAMLLSFLGLKSVVEFMLDSLPGAADAYLRGAREAWGVIPQRDMAGGRVQLFASDFQYGGDYSLAAYDFARGHEIMAMALLAAMAACLARGRGDWPALFAEVRHSARLGPKVAAWLEQNAEKLAHHPLLHSGGKGGATDKAARATSAGAAAPREVSGAAKIAKSGLRSARQLAGKAEGGPGMWQASPVRAAGADYQEFVTGVERGVEYSVPLASIPSGKAVFDGYDAERGVLLEAKDWKGYPPRDATFWQDETVKQAKNQLRAANGTPVEWHFSTQKSLASVAQALRYKDVDGVKLIFNPTNK
ncbi:MAG TPA: Tox-REase-5 domain-containing protein [Janthinobacterium sp.]|nr:Tox-REase-5 domain-containing protein [Janthinobacterium sp.]